MSQTPQRIAFVGAGAIGGYVGAHLFKAGNDVTLIDQWPEHVERIRRSGLHFSGTLGEYSVPVPALHIHEVQSLARKPLDVAFICTKLYDTAWATALIAPYVAPSGYVVTMQNGLVEELVESIAGKGRVLGCIASTMSAEAYAPGRIIRTRQPGGTAYTIFRAGELHGRVSARLQALVETLNAVDSAKATSNLWGERWSKLVANTMTTGVSAVTGLNLRSVLERADTRRLMVRLGAEAIAVGRALGYALEPIRSLPHEIWTRADAGDQEALEQVSRAIAIELERMTDEGYSGVAQDIRKGRRTEIDFMNGYVADKAREVGLTAPAHERLTRLVKRLECGEIRADVRHSAAVLEARD